jgi:hypothetical protein
MDDDDDQKIVGDVCALHEILAVFGREMGSVISPFGDT